MEYCVCKHKEDGSLFITTRGARETMINVLLDLGRQPNSIVLKSVDSYSKALKYISDLKQSDGLINNSIDEPGR